MKDLLDESDEIPEEQAEELAGTADEKQTSAAADELKCWEMRPNCMMKSQPRENASCPAYRQSLGCWEVDWKVIVESLPASQREYWLSFLDHCPNCIVYKAHPAEMSSRIDAVRKVVFDD